MCAPNIDTSRSDATAEQMAALSKEQWSWVMDQWEKSAPERAEATRRANAVSDAQLNAMQVATDQAKDYSAYEKSTFRPLEREVVAAARGFDTEAKREELAGVAAGDVQQAAAGARATSTRVAASMGMNPADGAFAAMDAGVQRDTTLAMADAKNKARTQATTMGHAMKMDAASLGRGLASAQATQAGLAQSSGNLAASTGLAALQPAQQGQAAVNGGFNAAMNGMQGAGNIFSQSAATQAKSNNNGVWSALGNAAGLWASGGFKMPGAR